MNIKNIELSQYLVKGTQRVLRPNYLELNKQTNEILSESHEKAQELLTLAEQAAENMQKIAHKQGYDEGIKNAVRELETILAGIEGYISKVENTVSDIVYDSVKSIVDNFDDLTTVKALVKRAIAEIEPMPSQVNLYVCSNAYAAIKDQSHSLFDPAITIDVYKDDALSNKQCRLETHYGTIEVAVDNLMDALSHHTGASL